MNFNLKNRPQNQKFLHGTNKRTCYAKYEDWFEGFEEELREKLRAFDNFEGRSSFDKAFKECCIRLLKEILGEVHD